MTAWTLWLVRLGWGSLAFSVSIFSSWSHEFMIYDPPDFEFWLLFWFTAAWKIPRNCISKNWFHQHSISMAGSALGLFYLSMKFDDCDINSWILLLLYLFHTWPVSRRHASLLGTNYIMVSSLTRDQCSQQRLEQISVSLCVFVFLLDIAFLN